MWAPLWAPLRAKPVTTTEAAIATREQFEPLLGGRLVHPGAYQLEPQGARLFVVLDRSPDRLGSIIVPETLQSKQVGAGLVLAGGPLLGHQANDPLATLHTAEALVCQHIYFSAIAGKGVTLPYLGLGQEYETLVVLTGRDIHFVNRGWKPPATDSTS